MRHIARYFRLCVRLGLGVVLGTSLYASAPTAAAQEKLTPIAITEVKRDTPVDFEKEVLPILRRSCLSR